MPSLSDNQLPWNQAEGNTTLSDDQLPWNQDLKNSTASGPWYDYLFSKEPYKNILQSTKLEGDTAQTELNQETTDALTKAGLYNDHKENEENWTKAFSEGLIRPFVQAYTGGAALLSAIGGATSGVGKELETGAKGLETRGHPVLAAPLGEAGEILGAAGRGQIAPIPEGIPSFGDMYWAKARAEGAIGEKPHVSTGLKEPTIDDSWFRAKAAGDLAPGLPAPSVHDLVRQKYPSLMSQYDKFVEMDNEFKDYLKPISDARDEIERIKSNPEASTEELNKVEDLKAFVQQKEVDPQVQLAREDMATNLKDLIDYTPEVRSAYREAQASIDAHKAVQPFETTEAMEISPEAEKAATETPASNKIYQDVYAKLVSAGRPEEEAQAAATLWQARYETRAARMGGKLGTSEELYTKEAPSIKNLKEGKPSARELNQADIIDFNKRKTEINKAKQYQDYLQAEREYNTSLDKVKSIQKEARLGLATKDEVSAAIQNRDASFQRYQDLYKPEFDRDLEQNKRTVRGTYNKKQNVIKLFSSADASTIFHESAHAWLEEFSRDASHAEAPEQLTSDFETVKKWLGNSGEELTRTQHEKFARGFERYLREGVAPNLSLAKVFAQLKEWLTKIYSKVSDLNVPINDDVRAVFDRLLSTEEEEERPIIEPKEEVPSTAKTPEQSTPSITPSEAPVKAVTPPEGTKQPEELQQTDRKFVDKAGNIRVADITSDQDVQQAIRDVVAANNDFISVRKGVVTETDKLDFYDAVGAESPVLGMQHIRDLATRYNMPLDQVMFAAGRLMKKAGQDTVAAAEKEDAIEFASAASNLIRLSETFSGLLAEWGKAGQAIQALYKENAETQSITEFLQTQTGKTIGQTKKIMNGVKNLKNSAQVTKAAKKLTNPLFGDWVTEFITNAYLSGPITHARYWLETFVRNAATDFIAHPFEAMIDATRSTLTGSPREMTMGDAFDGMYGFVKGQWSGIKSARVAMKLGIPQGLQLADLATSKADWEIATGLRNPSTRQTRINDLIQNPEEDMKMKVLAPQNYALGKQPVIPGVGGSFIRAPSERMVGPLHTVNYVSQLQSSLSRLISRQARLEGVQNNWSYSQVLNRMAELENNTPVDLIKQAREEALNNSIMSNSSEFVKRLQNLISYPVPGIGPILKWLNPFVAMNFKAQQMAYKSLFGPAINLLTKKYWMDMTGKNGGMSQTQAISKTVLGWSIAAVAWKMATDGIILGPAPDDRQEATVSQITQGLPNSIRIGEMSYSLDGIGPTGGYITLTGDLMKAWKDLSKDGNYGENALPALGSFIYNLGHQFMQSGALSGLADWIEAAEEDTGNKALTLLNQTLTSLTPFSVGLSQVAHVQDQYERMVTADGQTGAMGEYNRLVNTWKSKTPEMRETLMPKVDLFGNPVPSRGQWGVYAEKIESDPVYQALKTIKNPKAQNSANSSFFPAPVRDKIDNIPLTDEQYYDYATIAGQRAYQLLKPIITNPQFATMSAQNQAMYIKSIFESARRYAADTVKIRSRQSGNDIIAKSIQLKTQLANSGEEQ